ncbi:MAG: 30S ribosomal protein S9 [Candidatus Woesearchaeota archaeon]|nr:30S ribosomal protein S9 [Candidatus Woesearchaeota archaeon]
MKAINCSGKRKRAVARVTLKQGSGKIKVNNVSIELIQPEISRMKIMEPLILAGDTASKVDINVNVNGGGITSQAEAARLAIGRALVQFNKLLEKDFLDYDRQLLVADIRRKETRKPNRHGKARAKVQKSYR